MKRNVLIFDTEKSCFERFLSGLKQGLLDPTLKTETVSEFSGIPKTPQDIVVVNFCTEYFRNLTGKALNEFVDSIRPVRSKDSLFFGIVGDEYQAVQISKRGLLPIHDGNIESQLSRIFATKIFWINEKRVTLRNIQEKVSDWSDIPYREMSQQTRKRPIVQARQLTMFLSRVLTKQPLEHIGKYFGNAVHHTTVIHSCQTVRDRIYVGEIPEHEVRELIEKIAA